MEQVPTIQVSQSWEELFTGTRRSELEKVLPQYLAPRRWFGSKTRPLTGVSFRDVFRMAALPMPAFFTLLEVRFADGGLEHYVLPLAFTPAESPAPPPITQVARIEGAQRGILHDALANPNFCSALLDAIGRNGTFRHATDEIQATAFEKFSEIRGAGPLRPKITSVEQSNTSITFGDRLILKVFRRVQEGINPDLEVGRFLTEKCGFTHTAPVVGALEYRSSTAKDVSTLAILQGFVPNRGDAWKHTMDEMHRFADAVAKTAPPEQSPRRHLYNLAAAEPPRAARQRIGGYLDKARLLGQRTAELHVALASASDNPDFRPEPFSLEYQRSLVQTLNETLAHTFKELTEMHDLAPDLRELGRQMTEHLETIRNRLQPMERRSLSGLRCRCHGDYHLGQVLDTGADFIIIDFEGEPARPLAERRQKQSPLRDVAGMIRSFDYAAYSVPMPAPWHRLWYTWVSAAFLNGYAAMAEKGEFLPKNRDELKLLLDYYLLEKAIYEVSYEMNHRPGWVGIPLRGIMQLMETRP